MTSIGTIEITVSIDKVCNDALFEFAENFYKRTGVRLQRVEFDWATLNRLGMPTVNVLRAASVTSAGSGKRE
jgi:hypothetical protein